MIELCLSLRAVTCSFPHAKAAWRQVSSPCAMKGKVLASFYEHGNPHGLFGPTRNPKP